MPVQVRTPAVAGPELTNILKHWNLEVKQVCGDVDLAGSPARCDFRIAIDTPSRGLVVLERISPGSLAKKQMIAEMLDCLDTRKIPAVVPYFPSARGSFIVFDGRGNWQISPYVSGVSLNRPEYVFETWRGSALAEFLMAFWKGTDPVPDSAPLNFFSITSYIRDMKATLVRNRPGLLYKLEPVLNWLDREFTDAHDRLPARFCHGDFHPMNIIWSKTGINAVIDWEFCGIKPEIYDVANLIGCLGMEDPRALSGPMVCRMIRQLMSSEILSKKSWHCLPQFMTALRFAWMAEWLRNNDVEMIELETVYMNLLMNNKDAMNDIWHLQKQ